MAKLYDAAKTYDGKYYLVVEGGVPVPGPTADTASSGKQREKK